MRLLYAIGGYNNDGYLTQVEKYSLPTNKWRSHSLLPEGICSSSAVILNNKIYILAGYPSSQSILWCDLGSPLESKWMAYDFSDFFFQFIYYQNAFVLESKIVYFGSFNKN